MNDEVTDTSALSEEMASFCENYAIYYLKKIEDTVKSTRIQTNGKRARSPQYIAFGQISGGLEEFFRNWSDNVGVSI